MLPWKKALIVDEIMTWDLNLDEEMGESEYFSAWIEASVKDK